MEEGLMSTFHKMEIKCGLFEIGQDEHFPVWDLLRVYIYNSYIKQQGNAQAPRKRTPLPVVIKGTASNILYLFKSLWDCMRLPFYRGRMFFYESAHEVDEKGCYYNHISRQLIEAVPPHKRVVINCRDTSPTRFHDLNINILGLFKIGSIWESALKNDDFHKIKKAVKEYFNKELPYDSVNSYFVTQKIRIKRYGFLFKLLKPEKVFVAADIRKFIYIAAKRRGIETFEMQHAGIVFEYPSYSYPTEVTREWNIAFADNYLQFGPAWSGVNNIPAKRWVLGNDYFFPQKSERYFNENYVLLISNFKHAYYLKPLARELSGMLKDKQIIYKLHPNEFKRSEEYKDEFKDLPNVHVVDKDYNLQSLIAYTDMVVVIYSSVCFEALNQGKKVAVLMRDNYYILKDTLKNVDLVKNVDSARDIAEFYNADLSSVDNYTFYSHFDNQIANEILRV